LNSEEFNKQLKINSVVTVVDAKHILQQLNDPRKTEKDIKNEAFEQLVVADKILINKIDLVTEEELIQIEERIRKINKFAEIIRTQNSVVDIEHLLASNSFQIEKIDLSEVNVQAVHNPDVVPVFIPYNGEIEMEKLKQWLSWLNQEKGSDILRMKGLLAIKGEDQIVVLQGVSGLHDIHKSMKKKWDPNETRNSKIVMIGYNLDKVSLQKALHSFVGSD